MQLQVETIGQCNMELLKEKTEMQQKIEGGPNASAETDAAVMTIALYKEKIKSEWNRKSIPEIILQKLSP